MNVPFDCRSVSYFGFVAVFTCDFSDLLGLRPELGTEFFFSEVLPREQRYQEVDLDCLEKKKE